MPYKQSVAGIACKGDKVFIALRKSGGDLSGKWEFPGGKVEEGETCEVALKREYIEEFGVQIEVGPMVASAEFTHNACLFTLHAYRIFLPIGEFRMTEHTQWRWASLGDIEGLDFAGSDRLLLGALQSYLEQQSGIHDR